MCPPSTAPEMDVSELDLQYLCDLVRTRSAIVLETNKAYLFKARLEPLARAKGLGGIAGLVGALRQPGASPALANDVVDAMTTNETSFFRDLHPFETLREKVLPELIARRAATRRLNFWCAASSSGQEPYTVAMLLQEHFPELQSWQVCFVATDISPSMLERCRSGIYSQLEVNRGLPITYLVKYFEKQGNDWQFKEHIRRSIDFQPMNLIQPWPSLPKMDLVFMRNVLIYFDMDTKREILRRVSGLMQPDAALFLGTAETTLNIDESFHRVVHNSTTYYGLANTYSTP